MKIRISRDSVVPKRKRERSTEPKKVRLKLVFRESDEDSDTTLDILPPPDPEGLESRDRKSKQVASFLRKHFHYYKPFVCVAVLEQSENLADFIQRANYYGPYVYVLHNNLVIPKLTIACCDDIQNAISNAIEKHQIGPCTEKFTDLVKARTVKMKRDALRKAVIRTDKDAYAEARMPGKLTRAYVKQAYGPDGKPVKWPSAPKKRLRSSR